MIQVLLLDDHAVVRAGYRQLIDAEPDMRVCAEAATTEQACAAVREHPLDVAVVDLSLKDESGLEAIRRLLAWSPRLRVLVFTMHAQVGHAVQALRSGALGYLTKDSDPQEMLDAIRRVADGGRMVSPEIAYALLQHDEIAGRAVGPLEELTPREFEVLRMTARGATVREIAERMHLSPKTVMNHMSLVRQKVGAETDFQLLRLAASEGLVEW